MKSIIILISNMRIKCDVTRTVYLSFVTLIINIFSGYNSGFAQTFPSGFSQVQVATGLVAPTIMSQSPDGRIFIAEQGGVLRVFKNGALLASPFLSLNVNSSGERGLLGIAFDPSFNTNQYIYLYYTLSSGSNNRISRFTANGDVVVPGSEVVILNLDPLTSATNHNGGTMQFGPDGKLYVGVGDNATSANAQNLDTFHGKILRLNTDGTPAAGNPFNSGSVQRRSIWSYGMRNPYTLTFQPGTGKLFVNDVGQLSWEEVNDCTVGGGNYGWPDAEGVSSNPAYVNPVYAYSHGSGIGQGCAITGGTFFNPSTTTYPSQYTGNYFFIDYCSNWIDRLTISGSAATRSSFATGVAGSPVGIIAASDGKLYFLSRSNNSLYRIDYNSGSAPLITAQPQSISIAQGNTATFSVSASGAGLSYQWRKNTTPINGATAATYTISNVTSANAGNYSVVVSNSFGSTTSNTAVLTVTGSNTPPVANIVSPVTGSTYTAGTSITFNGSATDAEDGTLAAAAFQWYVDFHHDTHTHPGPSAPDGVTSGSFAIPNSGETASNVFYRLYLVVTDSQGARDTAYVDILPKLSTITLNTNPQGLTITLDGQPFTTPLTFTGVEGVLRTIGANSPLTINNSVTYNFSNWSQGGAQTQTFATPVANQTYTANYTPVLRIPENPAVTLSGIEYEYFEGNWNVIPDFATATPVSAGSVTNIDLSPASLTDYFGFRFSGFIQIPANGVYTFYTSSDDGSNLYIGNTLVVDNDGAHALQERSGQIGLQAGKHAITIDYFDRAGQEILEVRYEGSGIAKQLIPDAVLFRSTTATVLNPVADAYVRSGNYTNDNYGTAGQLITKKGTGNGKYETFLRFDISTISTNVTSAKLRLFGNINNTAIASVPVSVYNVPDNTWQETTIKFSTKPASGTSPLSTVTVNGTTSQYYEWDITSKLVALKAAGINFISLKVLNGVVTSNSRINFSSREAAGNNPQLIITSASQSIEEPPIFEKINSNNSDEKSHLVTIYPQPATDLVYIESLDQSIIEHVTLYDQLGNTISIPDLRNHSKYNISVSQLRSGLYTVELLFKDGIVRKQLLIMH